jgi:hypothetical protein
LINNQRMDRQKLTEVARGELYPDNESDLFRAALRFGASLTIQPLVLQDAMTAAGVSYEELNQEILVKVGEERSVRARVTKTEATAEGDTTVLPGKLLLDSQVAN